jgi:hypothetical protein
MKSVTGHRTVLANSVKSWKCGSAVIAILLMIYLS